MSGRLPEAASESIAEIKKHPDSVVLLKIYIDSLRKTRPYSEILSDLKEAIFSQGFMRTRNAESHLMLCYGTVCLREVARAAHQSLKSKTPQAFDVDFGRLGFFGDERKDMILAAFGMQSLSEEIRPILKQAMAKYPHNPFFFACAVEEFTGGYMDGNETKFKPGWGPDWPFVEKTCDSSIKKWPNYPTFHLYKGFALQRKKDKVGAVKELRACRDLIKARGGSRLYNLDQLIASLSKS